jgi:hypothetical protein
MPLKNEQIIIITNIKIEIEKNINELNKILNRKDLINDMTMDELIDLKIIVVDMINTKFELNKLIN